MPNPPWMSILLGRRQPPFLHRNFVRSFSPSPNHTVPDFFSSRAHIHTHFTHTHIYTHIHTHAQTHVFLHWPLTIPLRPLFGGNYSRIPPANLQRAPAAGAKQQPLAFWVYCVSFPPKILPAKRCILQFAFGSATDRVSTSYSPFRFSILVQGHQLFWVGASADTLSQAVRHFPSLPTLLPTCTTQEDREKYLLIPRISLQLAVQLKSEGEGVTFAGLNFDLEEPSAIAGTFPGAAKQIRMDILRFATSNMRKLEGLDRADVELASAAHK